MPFQGLLNATQTLYFQTLMFNRSTTKPKLSAHLVFHVGDFHPLLPVSGSFYKNYILNQGCEVRDLIILFKP